VQRLFAAVPGNLLSYTAAGSAHATAAAGRALRHPPAVCAAHASHAPPPGGARNSASFAALTAGPRASAGTGWRVPVVQTAGATAGAAAAVGMKRFFPASGCAAAPVEGSLALPTRPTATAAHESSSANSFVSPCLAGAHEVLTVAGPGPAKRRRHGQPVT
jgi:hypothetical protein